MQKSRIIIIGGGLAGLRAAIAAYDAGVRDIVVLAKTHPIRSNSVGAQGGLSAALDAKSIQAHIDDTIAGSDFFADRRAIEFIVEKGKETVDDLEKMGCLFARDSDKNLIQKQLAGHSQKIACYVADRTGHAIMSVLYEQIMKRRIKVLDEVYAVALIVDKKKCRGVLAYNLKSGRLMAIKSMATLIATGGVGQVFATTSNATSNTGDGLIMAFKAGVSLQNMELVQFHPTGIKGSGILITEAARSAGAMLLNNHKKRFMLQHPQKEMAPRDIVARAIVKQKRAFLDFRKIANIRDKLPQIADISAVFAETDISKELLEIEPTAHYIMGGIPTNLKAEVLNIKGLYAAGECAWSGMHGANRLGGNSLLEALVMGKEAGLNMAHSAGKKLFFSRIRGGDIQSAAGEFVELKAGKNTMEPQQNHLQIRWQLRRIMTHYCGVIRSRNSLTKALVMIKTLQQQLSHAVIMDASIVYNQELIEAWETKQMLLLSEIIVQSALKRSSSLGAHFRSDALMQKLKPHIFAKHSASGIKIVETTSNGQ